MVTILDSHNLFHTIHSKFGPDAKLDYSRLFTDRSIVVGYQAQGFENFLRTVGYEVYLSAGKGDNAHSTAHLIAQAIRMIPTDYIVLGTQDRNIVPIVEVLKGRGTYVEIFGAGIPTELRIASNRWTEVREDHLNDPAKSL